MNKRISKRTKVSAYADIHSLLIAMVRANDNVIYYTDWLYRYECIAPDCSVCGCYECPKDEIQDEIDTAESQRENLEKLVNSALEKDNILTIGEAIDYAECMRDPAYIVIDCFDEYEAEYYNNHGDIIPDTVYDGICKYITYNSDNVMILCNDADC